MFHELAGATESVANERKKDRGMVPLPLFIIRVAATVGTYAYFRVAIAFQGTSAHCSLAASITGHARLYSNFFRQPSCLSETPGRSRVRHRRDGFVPR